MKIYAHLCEPGQAWGETFAETVDLDQVPAVGEHIHLRDKWYAARVVIHLPRGESDHDGHVADVYAEEVDSLRVLDGARPRK